MDVRRFRFNCQLTFKENAMQRHGITRRRFVNLTAFGAASTLLPISALADEDASEPLRFGVIADVHKDVMHDADQRLRLFIEEMKREKVDFIIQLGDFCVPIDANLPFLKIWNSFSGPRYHVLGNHDTDGAGEHPDRFKRCLLYTSPSPRDRTRSRMPSSA